MVERISERELIERFKKEFGYVERTDFILSANGSVGIKKDFQEEKYTEISPLKLVKRPKDRTMDIRIGKIAFKLDYLYRVMKVFRRRKYFILGLYKLSDGNVVCIREGNNHILIAPSLGNYLPIKLEEIVESAEKLRTFLTYSKIFE